MEQQAQGGADRQGLIRNQLRALRAQLAHVATEADFSDDTDSFEVAGMEERLEASIRRKEAERVAAHGPLGPTSSPKYMMTRTNQ